MVADHQIKVGVQLKKKTWNVIYLFICYFRSMMPSPSSRLTEEWLMLLTSRVSWPPTKPTKPTSHRLLWRERKVPKVSPPIGWAGKSPCRRNPHQLTAQARHTGAWLPRSKLYSCEDCWRRTIHSEARAIFGKLFLILNTKYIIAVLIFLGMFAFL